MDTMTTPPDPAALRETLLPVVRHAAITSSCESWAAKAEGITDAVLAALAPHVTAQVECTYCGGPHATKACPDYNAEDHAAPWTLAAQVEHTRECLDGDLRAPCYCPPAQVEQRDAECSHPDDGPCDDHPYLCRAYVRYRVDAARRDALTEAADDLDNVIDLDRRVAADVIPWLRARAAVQTPDQPEEQR